MNRTAKIWRIAVAALTILAAVALIAQAADIYRAGVSPENLAGDGVYLRPVYSRENIAERLSQILPLILMWGVASAIGLFLPKEVEKLPKGKQASQKNPGKPNNVLRAVIAALALVLIVLGVLNGGMRDVLVKAINICTECIGLG